MKILLIGWLHLKWTETVILVVSTIIAIGLAYIAARDGSNVLSNEVIGPLVLWLVVVQSTTLTGVMRFRSKVINHLLTTCLVELREVRATPGEYVPTMALDAVAEFLGDKK